MELYVVGIGNVKHLELWEEDLRAIKLPFKYIDEKTKKETLMLMRLGVNRIQPYRLVFAEDQLDNVMSILGIGKESYVLERYPKLKWLAKRMRGFLGLKEAPTPKKIIEHMQPYVTEKAVAIIPIGTKKDNFNEAGTEHV